MGFKFCILYICYLTKDKRKKKRLILSQDENGTRNVRLDQRNYGRRGNFCPTFNFCAFLSPAVMKFSYSSFRKYKKLPQFFFRGSKGGKVRGFCVPGAKVLYPSLSGYVTIVGRNSFVYLLVKYRGIFSKEKEIQSICYSLNSFRIFIHPMILLNRFCLIFVPIHFCFGEILKCLFQINPRTVDRNTKDRRPSHLLSMFIIPETVALKLFALLFIKLFKKSLFFNLPGK